MRNRPFSLFVITACLFALCVGVLVWSLHKPFSVFLGNDEEQDYLGQAIRMQETGKPADFRHPGLLPKTVLYWALGRGTYTVESVQRAFRVAGAAGTVWLIVCLIVWIVLMRPYVRSGCAAAFLPVAFLNPATLYWLVKYGSNFFSIGMYLVLSGMLLRALVLTDKERFSLGWLSAAAACFGIASAIRVTFMPLAGFFLATVIGVSLIRPPARAYERPLRLMDLVPVMILAGALAAALARPIVRPREYALIGGVIAGEFLLIGVMRRYDRWTVRVVCMIAGNYVAGLCAGLCGFAGSMRKPIVSELMLTSVPHYLRGVRTCFGYAPFFTVTLFAGALVSLAMVVLMLRRPDDKRSRRVLPAAVYLCLVLTAGTLLNVSHYSIVSSDIFYAGVTLRLLLHAPFFLALLFTVLIPFWRERSGWLYALLLIAAGTFSVYGIAGDYRQLREGIAGEEHRCAAIDQYLAAYPAQPVLFIETVNAPAAIHYAMRNWGRGAGLERFHELYPYTFELNPEIRDRQAVEDICARERISLVVTDTGTLAKPQYRPVVEALAGYPVRVDLGDGVVVLRRTAAGTGSIPGGGRGTD